MKIPVVFAFDDNYALPASIAIQSLLDAKKPSTEYEIIVFHGGLSPKTIQKMEKICQIRWVKVDKTKLNNAPCSENWPQPVYYRLLIADLLPEYDKVIWSDVDVLFKGDLSNIYAQDLQGADWGGVVAEKHDEKEGVHPHFPENKKPYIYMSGFMVIDTKLWREKNMWNRFMDIIKTYSERLKFFDLDILNLAADKIYPIPFEYCLLENIYDDMENAPEYPWLERAQGKDALQKAIENPLIIHYTGRNPKVWMRRKESIPFYYWLYIVNSPFYCSKDYTWTFQKELLLVFLRLVKVFVLIKPWRKKIKQKIRELKGRKK